MTNHGQLMRILTIISGPALFFAVVANFFPPAFFWPALIAAFILSAIGANA